MGGYGSGFRIGGRKLTAEECLSLSIGIFQKQMRSLRPDFRKSEGRIVWDFENSERSSVRFKLSRSDEGPTLTLSYLQNGEPIRMPIPLVTTRTHFEGLRWWLECPLAVNGVPCHRRAGKLFLPPGARLFGCRECHRLSYRSSQEAHGMERLSARLGLAMDTSRLCAESLRKST